MGSADRDSSLSALTGTASGTPRAATGFERAAAGVRPVFAAALGPDTAPEATRIVSGVFTCDISSSGVEVEHPQIPGFKVPVHPAQSVTHALQCHYEAKLEGGQITVAIFPAPAAQIPIEGLKERIDFTVPLEQDSVATQKALELAIFDHISQAVPGMRSPSYNAAAATSVSAFLLKKLEPQF